MKAYKNERILLFSDLHAPYHHKDALDFLAAVKDKYSPDRVFSLGDELDFHQISFHPSDPDLFGPSKELEVGRKTMRQLEEIFPKLDLMKSNHGSLVHRRVVAAGLPRQLIKQYNQIYGVGDGWKWHFDLSIRLTNKQHLYMVHMKNSNVKSLSQSIGMNAVQGHYHGQFTVQYWANPVSLNWGMQLGALLDDSSKAFAYNKKDRFRPILGCGMVIDSQPKLIPMVLKKNGRWNGKVY